nr:PI-PLC X domain-containing protein At5g67130 [Tanacetum cinerariifolium]
MPKGGQDWPLVKDMVSNNQRLLVFGLVKSKEQSEGITYQWNYLVENQYGDGEMKQSECPNQGESSLLKDTSKSLVLVNYFRTLPLKVLAYGQNIEGLLNMTKTCYSESGNRWANFLAVDFYKGEGGGTFQSVYLLNKECLCGCNDVHSCVKGSSTELFLVILGSTDKGMTVGAVKLLKLDMNNMTWEEIKDLKDTVLSLELNYASPMFYNPAVASSEFGGYIHILAYNPKIIYSYHVKDKTISFSSIPCVARTNHVSAWAMLECTRLAALFTKVVSFPVKVLIVSSSFMGSISKSDLSVCNLAC